MNEPKLITLTLTEGELQFLKGLLNTPGLVLAKPMWAHAASLAAKVDDEFSRNSNPAN